MKQYTKLLKTIKKKGTYKAPARENMPGTTSLFGYQFRHNLAEGFPLLTTKKVNFKHIITELLWFLRGDTNIKYMVDNGCNIWNEDAYNYYLDLCNNFDNEIHNTFNFEEFVEIIKSAKDVEELIEFSESYRNGPKEFNKVPQNRFGDYELGSCGAQYGELWRCIGEDENGHIIDQIDNLITGLITNPMSRRHIITAWNPTTLNDMALNACHCMVQFNCRPLRLSERLNFHPVKGHLSEEDMMKYLDNKGVPRHYLDCQMYQRSADVFLGVPYNIASYALLTEILAKICNMVPGEYIHTFGDVHIYDNHKEQVDEQLERDERQLPLLTLGNNIDWKQNIDHITSSIGLLPDEAYNNLFKLKDYNPHPRIKGKLSTGLK